MLEIDVETTTTSEVTTTTSTASTSTMISTQSHKMDNFLKELFGLKDHMKPKTETSMTSTTTTSTTTTTTKKRTTKPIKVRAPSVVTRPGNRRPRPKSPLRSKSPTPPTTTRPRSSTTTQLDIVELLRTLEEQKRQEKKLNERLNVTTNGETTTQTSLTSLQNDNDEATLHFGSPEQERIRSNQETTEING